MAEGFNSKNVGQVEIKKNQFNLSHTHNTTAPFGSVQCINMQYIPLGNTTVNFKVSSIVRLLPLIAPTFGDIRHVVTHHFVRATDCYPFFNEVLAHKPVSVGGRSTLVSKIPYINNADLLAVYQLQPFLPSPEYLRR